MSLNAVIKLSYKHSFIRIMSLPRKLNRVSTASGNLLEFEIHSGNTENLEFNCSSWKFIYNRSMIYNDKAII